MIHLTNWCDVPVSVMSPKVEHVFANLVGRLDIGKEVITFSCQSPKRGRGSGHYISQKM